MNSTYSRRAFLRTLVDGRTNGELLRAIGLQMGVPAARDFGSFGRGVLEDILL